MLILSRRYWIALFEGARLRLFSFSTGRADTAVGIVFTVGPFAVAVDVDIGIIARVAESAFGAGIGRVTLLVGGRRRYDALEFVTLRLLVRAGRAAAGVRLIIVGGPGAPDVRMLAFRFR